MNTAGAKFETSFGLSSQLPPSSCPEIAFSGRSNVGKSTLLNKLMNRKSLARTSSMPGKTATVNFYQVDGIRLVDLPGYGYAKVAKTERRRWSELVGGYFDSDRELVLLIQLLDIRHAPTEDDRLMISYLAEHGIPFIVVLTKADKLNNTQRRERMAKFEQEFSDYEGLHVVPFSSVTGEGTDEIRSIIDDVSQTE